MSDLLEFFTLSSIQVIKIHAELLRPVVADKGLQTTVELKLTPAALSSDTEQTFQVGCAFKCNGFSTDEENSKPLFQIEYTFNAVYRQVAGDEISLEQFQKEHGSLNRQLYPLIQQKTELLFQQLGLNAVNLPLDLHPASVNASDVEKEEARVVH